MDIPMVVWLSLVTIFIGIIGWMSRTMFTDMRNSIKDIADRVKKNEEDITVMDKAIDINSTHDDYVQDKLESKMDDISKALEKLTKNSVESLKFNAKYSQALEILNKKITNTNI